MPLLLKTLLPPVLKKLPQKPLKQHRLLRLLLKFAVPAKTTAFEITVTETVTDEIVGETLKQRPVPLLELSHPPTASASLRGVTVDSDAISPTTAEAPTANALTETIKKTPLLC
uniref:Uncharacterized protein n=1 Tax=Panagrellus redivivus TaxID=6233 RepID=A0A7E4VTP7_PANRE